MTTKRFTGQYHEEALGLYFYGARWYDPLIGRFTQADTLIPDPASPQAFNRYAYTLNNPLRYVDPSGHRYSPCGVAGAECGGSGHTGDSGISPTPPPPPTPLPLGWPTSTPTATPGPQWLPPFTPTPGPFLAPTSPRPTSTPTATPVPLGKINIPDKYWTVSTWLTFKLPEALLEDAPSAIRSTGRAAGNFDPLIEGVGWVASVGPNLVNHIVSRDSGTEIATDLVVDTGGWGVSIAGATTFTAVGATFGSAIAPGVGTAVGAAVGNLFGSLATSAGYDVYVVPRIRPYVREAVGFVTGQ